MGFIAPVLVAGLAGGGAAAAGAGLGTALAVAGTTIAGLSQYQQSRYQTYVARNNAKIAEQKAAQQAEASQIEAMRSDREYAATIATQLAEQSASGLDVLGRSQLRVRDRTREVARLGASDIRRQGERETADLFQEGANYRSEARALSAKATSDLFGTVLSAGSALSKDKGFTSKIGGARSTNRKGIY